MPSCDGAGSNCSSNCSACSVRTEYITKEVHLDERERKKFEKKIHELQAELANEHKLNKQLVERLLEEKRL